MESARALMLLSLQGMSLAAAHDAGESTDIAVRGVSGVTDRDAAVISTSMSPPLRNQPQLLIPANTRARQTASSRTLPANLGRDARQPPLACDLPPHGIQLDRS